MRTFLLIFFSLILMSTIKAQINDLELIGFQSPGSYGCDYADSTAVTIEIRNNGTTSRTGFDVTYRIFSVIVSTETVNAVIPPNGSINYTFNKKVLISSPAIYAFSGWIANNGIDVNISNDTILLHPVYVSPIIKNYPYIQDFEQSLTTLPNDWVNDPDDGNDDWFFGKTASSIDADHTTGNGYMAFVDNSSPNQAATNLLTPCLDLSSMGNPHLEFYLFNPASNGSIRLYVDVLSNGVWQNIGGPLGFQSSSEWAYFLYDLNSFAGEVVKIRFRGSESGSSSTPDMGLDDIKIYNRPPINLDVIQANSPQTDCGLSSSEVVDVDVLQLGYDSLNPGDMVTMSYQINGGSVVTETVNINTKVRPLETFNYVFNTTADLSTLGTYHVKIWSSHPQDDDFSNDTLEYEMLNVPYIQQFPYTEDFESGDGQWEPGGDNSTWAFGTPNGSVIREAASGKNAWGTGNLQGSIFADERSYLISPCFDFSMLNRPQISFNLWYECWTGIDGANLQYSTDNGMSWNLVGEIGDPINWYNDNTILSNPGGEGPGWSGYLGSGSNGWINVKHFLDDLAGESAVRFRVAFSSYISSGGDDGIAVDDFVIGETPRVPLPPVISDCGFVVLNAGANAAKVNWSTGDSSQTITVASGSQNLQQEFSVYIENSLGLYNVDTVEVNLSPGPYVNLGPDTVVCGANSLELDSKVGTSASVLWDDNSTAQTRTVTSNNSYWVQVTALGCTKSDTISVAFDEFPLSKFGYEQESIGRVLMFEDSSEYANSYHWDFGDGYFSTLANPEHFYEDPGNYTVTLIVTNDCGTDTLTRQINVIPRWGVGINSADNANLRVFPNPTDGIFRLEFKKKGFDKANIELFDLQGRRVAIDQRYMLNGLGQAVFDFRDLPSGMYVLRVELGSDITTLSIVKR